MSERETELSSGGAVKNDGDKLRYDLIPAYPLRELARVYTIGAKKYGDYNWLKGMAWSRVQAALMRHYEAWRSGEMYDTADGQHHLASVIWCAMTLLVYEAFGLGTDDRPMTHKQGPNVIVPEAEEHLPDGHPLKGNDELGNTAATAVGASILRALSSTAVKENGGEIQMGRPADGRPTQIARPL